MEIVGEIPAGLAPPQWPAVGLQNWWLLLPGALGLALVNFAEAIGPVRSFAAAHKYKVDPNQELIGLGAANFGAGLFQGFPIGSSLSKSAANDRAGAHSQMSGIIAAVVTALVALFFTQWFYALPEAVLGAIVIVAVSGMVKVAKFKHLYRVRRADFILAVVALLAVLTFETLEALLIAVVVSLFALVWRTSATQVGGAGSRARQPAVRRYSPAPGKQDRAGPADRAAGKRPVLRQRRGDPGGDSERDAVQRRAGEGRAARPGRDDRSGCAERGYAGQAARRSAPVARCASCWRA